MDWKRLREGAESTYISVRQDVQQKRRRDGDDFIGSIQRKLDVSLLQQHGLRTRTKNTQSTSNGYCCWVGNTVDCIQGWWDTVHERVVHTIILQTPSHTQKAV